MRRLFMLLILLSCGKIFAQAPDTLWTRTYGGGADDRCFAMIQSEGGGYALAGYTESFGAGNQDLWLLRINSDGDSMWSRTYGGVCGQVCFTAAQCDDGGYVFAGYDGGNCGTLDYWIVRTDSVGDTAWVRTIINPGTDYCYSIQQTSDGGFVMAGHSGPSSESSGLPFDFYIVKVDSQGETLWTRTYGMIGDERCRSVRQTGDGGYVVAGYTTSIGAGNSDYWLLKLSGTGDSLWSRTFGGISEERCNTLEITGDGGFVLAGYTHSTPSGDFYLVKTNSDGVFQWSKTYGGVYTDRCNSLVLTDDGGYALVGETYDVTGHPDIWLMQTNSSGDSLWSRRFGTSDDEYSQVIARTVEEGYVLAGFRRDSTDGDFDVMLLKIGFIGDSCTNVTPLNPEVTILTYGNDSHLYWNPITHSVAGCPITTQAYDIYSSATAEGVFTFLDSTPDTFYVHSNATNDDTRFYHVRAMR